MTRTITAFLAILLFAGIPSRAQSPDSTSGNKLAAPDAKAADASQEKKKPKKVWTNDEIGKVSGGVSVVGDAKASGPESKKQSDAAPSANDQARQRQIDSYRKQLNDLQSQIDTIDKRISQLKNFKGDNTTPSGGININQGYNMVPLEDQVKQLEDKKKQLQTKMDDVESDAHKNGITADDLR